MTDMSDHESWMYELAGAKPQFRAPARAYSLWGSQGSDNDEQSGLDEPMEEVRAEESDKSVPMTPSTRSAGSDSSERDEEEEGDREEAWITEALDTPVPEWRWTKEAFKPAAGFASTRK